MTKQELSELLHSLGIPANEGISSDENINKYPRIVYGHTTNRTKQRQAKAIITL